MFKETAAIPTVNIRVEFDATGDEITLTGKEAFSSLYDICKEHNVPFRAELFSDVLSELELSPDYVEYRHKIIISDGYKMIPAKESEMYVLKNIHLIKGMISPLFETITNFGDILAPKTFAETLNIGSRLESRLTVIQSALHTVISIIRAYGQGVGWGQVCNRIFSIINNIGGISKAIKNSDHDIDKKLSSLKEDISNMFDA